jgi:hypothetical protein
MNVLSLDKMSMIYAQLQEKFFMMLRRINSRLLPRDLHGLNIQTKLPPKVMFYLEAHFEHTLTVSTLLLFTLGFVLHNIFFIKLPICKSC